MTEKYIPKEKLSEAATELLNRYRVYGPVFNGKYHEFAELKSAADLDLAYSNTRLSPKGLFHPQAERMFEYSLAKDDPEAGIVKETPKDYSPRVILGIRPCDAKALKLMDCNFDTSKYVDPWWAKRMETTTLVGLACNAPSKTCFCTTVDSGPFDASGLDVLLTDLGDGYLATAYTDKGNALLSELTKGEAVPAGAADKAAALQKTAEGSMGIAFDKQAIAQKPMMDLFNAPFWEEVQFACINCGTCTFGCPTCWCFDIQDEVYGEKGDRIRLWDSCMFPLFTLHGSGHNPRQNKVQRVRQRFMHKLKYYTDKYGEGVACTGCGRCVRACPVNIDIRKVARLMAAGCACPA
jgi:ferredoxin